MKKTSIYFILYFCSLATLQGQIEQLSFPGSKEINTKRATFNLEEIKVRWKKAALENCTGVPCIVTPPAPSFTCGTSTMTDKDNNTYSTVSIGAQCWTTTNLKVTQYDDGSLIGDSTTSTWGTALIGARTGYDVSVVPLTDYVGTFGYLYNWYAVNDPRKLCPAGWHVPTDAEWTTLETYLNTVAPTGSVGDKMKSNNAALWTINTGTNTSGFSALPGGFRSNNGTFNNITTLALFWSATQNGTSQALYRYMINSNGDVTNGNNDKSLGASVRCLRD